MIEFLSQTNIFFSLFLAMLMINFLCGFTGFLIGRIWEKEKRVRVMR